MSLKQLNELYITSGLVGFLATRRVTGAVTWPDAIRVLREAT
jgi:HK97 family phage major capsid protein